MGGGKGSDHVTAVVAVQDVAWYATQRGTLACPVTAERDDSAKTGPGETRHGQEPDQADQGVRAS